MAAPSAIRASRARAIRTDRLRRLPPRGAAAPARRGPRRDRGARTISRRSAGSRSGCRAARRSPISRARAASTWCAGDAGRAHRDRDRARALVGARARPRVRAGPALRGPRALREGRRDALRALGARAARDVPRPPDLLARARRPARRAAARRSTRRASFTLARRPRRDGALPAHRGLPAREGRVLARRDRAGSRTRARGSRRALPRRQALVVGQERARATRCCAASRTASEVERRAARARARPAHRAISPRSRTTRSCRASSGATASAILIKNPEMTEGLSDLPWHRDCGMGGHASMCPVLIFSIYLAPSRPETGELRMLPGSHEASLGFFEATDPRAPRGVGLAADPGDVTLHYGDIMHAAPPPTGAGPFRKCVLLSFARADAYNHRGETSYNDVLLSRDGRPGRAPREGRAACLNTNICRPRRARSGSCACASARSRAIRGTIATEITIDHQFLMSSANTASERALADRALALHAGDGALGARGRARARLHRARGARVAARRARRGGRVSRARDRLAARGPAAALRPRSRAMRASRWRRATSTRGSRRSPPSAGT